MMSAKEKCELLFLQCQMEKALEEFESIDKFFTPIEELERVRDRYYDLYDKVNSIKNKE